MLIRRPTGVMMRKKDNKFLNHAPILHKKYEKFKFFHQIIYERAILGTGDTTTVSVITDPIRLVPVNTQTPITIPIKHKIKNKI